MKRIYLEGRLVGWKLHSLYRELIRYPPENYEFVTDEEANVLDQKESAFHLFDQELKKKTVWKKFSDLFRPWLYFLYYGIKAKPKPKNCVLTYSAGHLVFRKEPWVVDLEHAGTFAAYGYRLGLSKRFIEGLLSSKYCKKIMPWSDAGKKTLFLNLNCKNFENKIETVPLAVSPKKFVKKFNGGKIKLLFIGTARHVPDSFYHKGGKVVFEAFKHLNEKYNDLELIVRSYVPSEIRNEMLNFNNVKIIHKPLPQKMLENLFKTSDIFLHPGYFTPGMVILDAMSYELPVVTTNVWANSEIIKDGETGFLIEKSHKVPYYTKNFIPKEGTADVMRIIKDVDPILLNNLVDKTSILIDDETLRKTIGSNARKEIETGKFSIKKRNLTLKRIFDEALGVGID